MSLVAYDTNSDEESDYEDNEGSEAIIVKNTSTTNNPAQTSSSTGHISDDDEFIPPFEENEKHITNLSKLLPKPKKEADITDIIEGISKPTFNALPAPKLVDTQVEMEEEDDEFLHKKPPKELIENNDGRKKPVKITIPSLKTFQDVEKELADTAKKRNKFSLSKATTSSGLVSMLPKPKSEQSFAKETKTLSTENKLSALNEMKPAVSSFIPDSVRYRRPAANTEDVDSCKPSSNKVRNQINKDSTQNDIKDDTDESDDEHTEGDNFLFSTNQNLPEVSVNEINNLVAKKAAKMMEASSKFLEKTEAQRSSHEENVEMGEQELESSRKRHHEEASLNSEAIQALVGGSTKRRRQQPNIQVIDLNSSQVMPNKDEWMRVALASTTAYQPTGVLVDEEPASGTRRKHQITYLAHKAKANEAELQAMWSANRQNRRATQSKYGF